MATNTDPANVREFTSLLAGERFTAIIADIKPDLVVLKLGDGSSFNARSLVVPEARIGQYAQFLIKENDGKGHIVLELVKGTDANTKGFSNFTKEILLSCNMPLVKENFELVNALIENKMPVDKHTINNALFFKYTSGDLDKTMFCMKEDFPTDPTYVHMLDMVLADGNHLLNTLRAVADMVWALPEDGPAKQAILSLVSTEHVPTTKKEFLASLTLPLQDATGLSHVTDYYKRLFSFASHARRLLADSDYKDLCQILDRVQDSIRFMNHIQRHKQFLQLPMHLNGQLFQANLYIVKDGKNLKATKANMNLCLTLDTVALGHIEVHLTKTNDTVALQFHVRNKEVETLISTNIGKWLAILKQKRLVISSKITYHTIDTKKDKPFNLLKASKTKTDEPEETVKRYSFDMRV